MDLHILGLLEINVSQFWCLYYLLRIGQAMQGFLKVQLAFGGPDLRSIWI